MGVEEGFHMCVCVCVCVCVCGVWCGVCVVWCGVCVVWCVCASVHVYMRTCVQFFGEDSLISTITHIHSPSDVCSLCACTSAAAILCGPRLSLCHTLYMHALLQVCMCIDCVCCVMCWPPRLPLLSLPLPCPHPTPLRRSICSSR